MTSLHVLRDEEPPAAIVVTQPCGGFDLGILAACNNPRSLHLRKSSRKLVSAKSAVDGFQGVHKLISFSAGQGRQKMSVRGRETHT